MRKWWWNELTILSSWSPLLETESCCWSLPDDKVFLDRWFLLGFDKSKNNPKMKPMTRPGMKFSGLKLPANHSPLCFCCCCVYIQTSTVLKQHQKKKCRFNVETWTSLSKPMIRNWHGFQVTWRCEFRNYPSLGGRCVIIGEAHETVWGKKIWSNLHIKYALKNWFFFFPPLNSKLCGNNEKVNW